MTTAKTLRPDIEDTQLKINEKVGGIVPVFHELVPRFQQILWVWVRQIVPSPFSSLLGPVPPLLLRSPTTEWRGSPAENGLGPHGSLAEALTESEVFGVVVAIAPFRDALWLG